MLGTREPELPQAHDKNESITLKEFLEKQRETELEAAAALPFKFDQCSAEFGPLRQNLHICHNCPNLKDQSRPVAFCYSCAVTCHNFDPENLNSDTEERDQKSEEQPIDDVFDAYGDEPSATANLNLNSTNSTHSIEEIWARRNFICDCPSTGHCKLLPAVPKGYATHVNSYHRTHNFFGRYCFCDGKGWEVGDRTMYQCEVCEDWYHDTCVAKDHQNHQNNDEIEIPAESTFTDFICKGCVQRHYDTFFANIGLNDVLFTVPKLDSLKSQAAPLFLANGWREILQLQFDGKNLTVPIGLEHLLEEGEQVYEPEIDSEAKESLYDLGLRALEQSTPRDQAILGIKMIDSLKDRLKDHLESLVATDPSHTITAEDIRSFFEGEESERLRIRRKRSRLNDHF